MRSSKETREYHRKYGKRIRAATIALLGGVCQKCSFSDIRALQVDHVNGGGTKQRKELGNNNSTILKKIQESPNDYQLLCANCNWIKRFELGEHKPQID